ncbi:CBS domain-containing protein [Croceicoccus mobilis]|uniref:Inosine-5-monophosphate dehydrogenase n=1 Tax=Croceicoccus mobilis TaxID=1703339 RepID=A0A916YTK6_9SPHN|nr:CBS domain-containing protein [Croceicoccus mobilis]GGD60220.1 inosine-5-monophosphate dehydrogenase [Croceicoccus mobilis]
MSIAAIIETRDEGIVTCRPDHSVAEAITLLTGRRIGAMPVVDETGAVEGVFSERDVIRCLQTMGADALNAPVSDAMTSPAVTVGPEMSELEALALMTRRRIRHLPVVDNGRLVDFVSIGDLVKARIDTIEAEANAMRAYIRSA